MPSKRLVNTQIHKQCQNVREGIQHDVDVARKDLETRVSSSEKMMLELVKSINAETVARVGGTAGDHTPAHDLFNSQIQTLTDTLARVQSTHDLSNSQLQTLTATLARVQSSIDTDNQRFRDFGERLSALETGSSENLGNLSTEVALLRREFGAQHRQERARRSTASSSAKQGGQ